MSWYDLCAGLSFGIVVFLATFFVLGTIYREIGDWFERRRIAREDLIEYGPRAPRCGR